VIHTVGPIWKGGDAGEDRLLASAYASSLALTRAHDLRSVAFPAISTGVYAFPPDRAARIAVGTVVGKLESFAELDRVVFCCFSASSAAHHEHARRELGL
jgi:O-acetyl-ADP-ribose deacetylase (regulator of RNase III)